MSYVEDKPWLLSFIRRMRVRPGMYLGSEEVRALDLYLTAYAQARLDLGLPEHGPGEERLLPCFQQWLEKRLKTTDTRGWWGLIEQADPTGTNVRTFLALFDEFLLTEVGGDERPL